MKQVAKYRVYFYVLLVLFFPCYAMATGKRAATPHHARMPHLIRLSASFGPRYINDKVMEDDRWGTVMRMSITNLARCETHACFYGFQLAANSAWSSRFDSVNDPSSVEDGPVGMHDAASLDFLWTFEWDTQPVGVELNFGPQISWIKWQNTVQQHLSDIRIVPKLRVAFNHSIYKNVRLFVAASQEFNPYGKLRCHTNKRNCFNDNGYVSVTDVTLGVSAYL